MGRPELTTLPPNIFTHNRGVVTPQYAVMPPEGILTSRLPGFDKTTVRFQTSPEMGAHFAQAALEIEPGGGTTATREDGLEHFFYLVSGAVSISIDGQMLYYLAGDLHEVQTHDFIWMSHYCPQFCFCTGWEDAAYLLYKDVNRDVSF